MTVVFVYGTLTDPVQVSRLLEEYRFGPEAICHGLQRVDGRYPTLIPGSQVSGRLLSTPEMDQLDSYEGLDRGLYCRVSVPVASTQPPGAADDPEFAVDTVDIYLGDPSLLNLTLAADWPDSAGFRQSVIEYIDVNNVRIHMKTPSGDDVDDH